MPTSAFIVEVPSAEALVGDLRERFDSTAQLGVPAHVTVLYPFMDPAYVTPAVLQKARTALVSVSSFEFSLEGVGRFRTTAYLAPFPLVPFTAMTASLAQAFPEFPPYGGEHAGSIPHLTVAHGDVIHAEVAAAELEDRLRLYGPIETHCSSVVLIENSTGRWGRMHVFHLPAAVNEARDT
ncbi:2'-5' RNA ligase family protein [Variovorax sp. YR216]|uniref:2'-5' RNA ligase family protein n=1 Tax=Variovorax sp. YR216 TaxID=1882828 RepID=UPI000A49AE82|nr:2'-5' RNA ligase family protein [Variovorax sp. YR216]